MKRLFLAFAFFLLAPLSALAVDVAITSISTATQYQYSDTTMTLRVYANSDFTTSDGHRVFRNAVGSAGFYFTTTCTATGHTLTCATLTLPSTTDSSDPDATYSGVLFDSHESQKEYLFKGFRLEPPAANSPATITFQDWEASNQAQPKPFGPTYYSAQQVDQKIAAIPIATISNEVSIENYASLTAALSAIGGNVKTLVISIPLAVPASTTVPANVTLRFTGQGELIVSPLQTLTVQGPVVASSGRAIFTGTGTTSFSGNKVLGEIDATWLGVTCNGSTDDAPFYQRGVNAVGDGQTLSKPDSCTMKFATQVTISDKKAATFKLSSAEDGYAHSHHDVEWAGAIATPIFLVRGSGSVTLSGGFLYSNVAGTSGIDIDSDGVGVSISVVVRGMTFNFLKATTASYGARVAFTSNSNNERMQFHNNACFFSPNVGSLTDSTNLTRGTCFKVGDISGATGFNVLNVNLENNYWLGVSYGLDFANGGTVLAKSNQSNFASIDYKLYPFTQSSPTIMNHRSETQRQFVTQEIGSVILVGFLSKSPSRAEQQAAL